MELKIIGEPTIDFWSDLQKLAVKHKIAIMTSQQKKSSPCMKEVAESFKKVFKSELKVVVRAKPNRIGYTKNRPRFEGGEKE